MNKTIIELKCVDQVLTFVNTPIVASGGVGEDYLSIEFCSKWSGYTVSVFFWRQGVDPISVLADSDGLYKVPSELTYNEGVVYFGAVGVNAENERRTSEAISYRIQEGAITENTTLPHPDVYVFDQLLAQYADVKLYVASCVDTAATAAANAEKSASEVQAMIKEGGYIPSTEKGASSGVASLDETGKVPSNQLPSMDYIPTSEKGASSGVASLDETGKVPSSQIPPMEYIPTSEKGAASGVASLDDYGKVPSRQLPTTIPKFEAVQYSGTGTVGENGKTKIELSFSPKVVFILDRTYSGTATLIVYYSSGMNCIAPAFWPNAQSVTSRENDFFEIPLHYNVSKSGSKYYLNIWNVLDDDSNGIYQFNASGKTYTAYALG
ncbi:MAG: hypothetical protein SOY66_08425 [Evtepia sp.]|nr:hypothetical protein [Evtepia sp.]